MKNQLILALLLGMGATGAQAQQTQRDRSITIVSDPATWYADERPARGLAYVSNARCADVQSYVIDERAAPPPEAFSEQPYITSLPGPIPENWHVTRLDPWTRARVMWLNGAWAVVTWGSSRAMAH